MNEFSPFAPNTAIRGQWLILMVLSIIWSNCQPKENPSGIKEGLRTVPASDITMDIKLPITAMQNGINQTLPRSLADVSMALDKKRDSLFLHIQRIRKVKLAYQNQQVYVAIPIKVSAAIKKKVLGMVLTNRKQPIVFTATAHISGPVDLDENWNPVYDFKWRSIEWEHPPMLELMGIQLDLTQIVEQQIINEIPTINQKINQSIRKGLKLSQPIKKAFEKIQKPLAVRLAGQLAWLQFRPSTLRGSLLPQLSDTLGLRVSSSFQAHLSTNKIPGQVMPLPNRQEVTKPRESFQLYLDVRIPFDFLNANIDFIKQQTLTVEGYQFMVENARFYPEEGFIHCEVYFSGDRSGKVIFRGIPSIEKGPVLAIKKFGYRLIDGDEWVTFTDAAFHRSFELMLEKSLVLSMQDQLDHWEKAIVRAIENSPQGDKLDLSIDIHDMTLFDIGLTKDELQMVLEVTGQAGLLLEEGALGG